MLKAEDIPTEMWGDFLVELYSQLSHEIHGASWSGPGVRVYIALFNERQVWVAVVFFKA